MPKYDESIVHPLTERAWSAVTRLVSTSTRRTLYHYTSIRGLHGIVTSGSIWATDAAFLNDPSERVYAWRVIQESFGTLKPTCSLRVAAALERWVNISREVSQQQDMFVACFSERDDLLSQWVRYTPAAAGVSIGFRGTALTRAEPHIRPVIYAPARQRALISALLAAYRDALKHLLPRQHGRADLQALGGMFAVQLNQCAWSLKHEAFAAEREWRLVHVRKRGHEAVQHRVVGELLTPYLEVPLPRPGGALPIVHIVLGPGADHMRNAKSVDHFLRRHQVVAKISSSRVPFRTSRGHP